MDVQAQIDIINEYVDNPDYVVWFDGSRTPIGSIIRENPHYDKPNWGIWGRLYYSDTIQSALDTVIIQPLLPPINWR